MYYREAGQFKTTYAADSRIFPILQDRAGMLLLCAIAFMPFSTSYMNSNSWQLVPTAFYAAMLLITALLNIWLVHRATAPGVVAEDADRHLIIRTRSRGWAVATGAAIALVVAFVSPIWSQPSLSTIPLWLRVYGRIADRRATAPA